MTSSLLRNIEQHDICCVIAYQTPMLLPGLTSYSIPGACRAFAVRYVGFRPQRSEGSADMPCCGASCSLMSASLCREAMNPDSAYSKLKLSRQRGTVSEMFAWLERLESACLTFRQHALNLGLKEVYQLAETPSVLILDITIPFSPFLLPSHIFSEHPSNPQSPPTCNLLQSQKNPKTKDSISPQKESKAMGKNKKGGKSAAQPAKGKADKKSVHPLCIRYPDLETAHDPKTHSLEDCILQTPGNSNSNKKRWSGFPSPENEPFDLNSLSPHQCQKLLDEVQAKNDQAVAGMASRFMVISNTEDYRKAAKSQKIPITKKILDYALDTAIKNKASVPEQSSGNGDGKASGSKKGKAKAGETTPSEQPDPSTLYISKLAITEKPHNAFVAEQFMKTPLSQLGHETYAAPSAAQRQDASASSHRDEAQPLDDPDPRNIPAQAASINHTAIGSVADFTPPHGTPSSNMPLRTSLATKDNKTPVPTNHFTPPAPRSAPMILDMIEHDPLLWKERDHIATDCQKKIISDRPLYNDVQLITVNDYVPGTRDAPKAHKLELQYVACHQMDSLLEYVNGADMEYSDHGATDALNIVLSKAVTDGNRDTFQVGTNRFYFRAGWHDIDDGLIAVRGYFSSIKPSMGNILLNVNTVTSPFYKAQDVSKYLELPNLQNKNAAESFLAKRRVYVNFKRNDDPNEQGRSVNSLSRRCKTLVSLGAKPKEQQFFEHGTKKSVWKHLRSKYINDTPETCEKYFTANVGSNGGENGENGKYYMATQLKVLPGQPYNGQLSASATSKMIDYARRGPRENVDTIMGEGMTSLQLQKLTQPLITALGLTISQVMAKDRCAKPRQYHRSSGIDRGEKLLPFVRVSEFYQSEHWVWQSTAR
ncbi:hypothetical protein M409DRAFT_60403 [Zasmidium cellare ATCC 36951]|uniref:Argonaute linker 1 domain-containing protein n=1 Tax=Zasmidium cellare ATCC 36951 TaxID=1080233 RepID=A0A6A6BZG3_ZASCE|nr:uncharacterized protein M409DRAFT_60403 [Zasmidium cellare ATCC 36951]KAF2160003.1 hypothetical protein M409DRAFT_60403 [Zasmidium cellare ATCC 36951]